jgi:hypothetical protein
VSPFETLKTDVDEHGMNRLKLTREAIFGVLLVAVGLTYFQSAMTRDRLFQKEPTGYYGALTDAFRSGQVSLKATPDPRLLKLENPYLPQADIPRPHDMSLYKGKFYLYFGATPVILLFLPWRVLTGHWLADQNGTIIFCFGGFVMAALLLRRIKDRYFAGCGDLWLWLGVAAVGWGSPIFYLALNGTFYAVPISAAFFCIMVAVVAAERAVVSPTHARRSLWIGVASLAYGFAVGARPNYIFCLPILPLLGFYLARSAGERGAKRCLGTLIAAVAPAAVVGSAIAAYNYRRFGSPFEFGMRFALMPEDIRNVRLMGAEYLGGNVFNYLFKAAHYVRYYPFFLIDRAYGMALYLPLSVLGPPLLVGLIAMKKAPVPSGLVAISAALLGIASCNLLSMGSFYYFGELRYMADFAPAALVLGVIATFAVMSRAANAAAPSRWASSIVVAGLSLFSITNGALAALQDSSDVTVHRLEYPTYWAEKMAGTGQGPIEMEVQFPMNRSGSREPLLSTGVRGQGDIVYIEYLADRNARIGLFHLGSGGPVSDPFAIGPGSHRVALSLGSLYPPAGYPGFSHLPSAYVQSLKRHFEVKIDDRSILNTSASFYFATPELVYIGANPLAVDVSDPWFTGQISGTRRLGIPQADDAPWENKGIGPLRLTLRFPKGRGGIGDPLVSTGKPGAGDIFFVTYLDADHVRFGIENSGNVLTSSPVTVDFNKQHVINLEMGSFYPPNADFNGRSAAEIARLRTRYSVRLDGNLVIIAPRNFQPSEPGQIVTAVNTLQASTTEGAFSGTIVGSEHIEAPLPRMESSWGPLDAWVVFPNNSSSLAQPLVASGISGKGDVIYARIEDQSHVRFGFDHWSVGGPVSDAISLDLERAHHLEVTMGSMYPPLGNPEWLKHKYSDKAGLKGRVQVKIDGKVVLNAETPSYDCRSDQLAFWSNPIGASSCQDEFAGTVVQTLNADW